MAKVNSITAFSRWFDPRAPKSYKAWYNSNLVRKLTDINNAYVLSFNRDLFEVDTDHIQNEIAAIKWNVANRANAENKAFEIHDKKMSNGIPKAIINNYYILFLEQWDGASNGGPAPDATPPPGTDSSGNQNFTYEQDLQLALINQAEELFDGYKIYGENNEGVEYCINGKRIDLLLEHKTENKIMAIELKAGCADSKVFGQISMYLSLLEERFPGKEILAKIIAGEIDNTLRIAAKRDKSITLMSYKMALTLSDETEAK